MKRMRFFVMGMFLFCTAAGQGYASILNGTADLVLGQPYFVTGDTLPASAATLNGPQSIAFDHAQGRIFVADTYNNRVLWWNNVSGLANGQAADGILGQANFTSGLPNQGLGGPAAGTLHLPTSVCVDPAGRLWVADGSNNRVLRFDSPTTKSTADFVLGQPNMTSNFGAVGGDKLDFPLCVAADPAGTLWVVDENNNRVLGFTAANIASGQADYVIGQADFNSKIPGPSRPVGPDTLYSPQGVFADAAGNLWIGDDTNHRVLRFSPPFTATGMRANLELGQADFYNTGLNVLSSQNRGAYNNAQANTHYCSMSVTVDKAGNVWVADFNNDRIIRHSGPLDNGMNAVQVIGQPDFISTEPNRGGAPAANAVFRPNFVTVDAAGNLWVCEGRRFSVCHEGGNNRVLKFNTITVETVTPAQWHNGGPKAFTLQGTGIAPGTTVRLTKAGQNDIPGTSLSFAGDGSQLQCTFDLTGAAAGTWDLVFTNGSYSNVLANALTVVAVRMTSVSPAAAVNDNPVTMTINGENIGEGIVPKLTQGAASIDAENVAILSATQLTCRFNILDAATGYWNVSLNLTPEGTLPNAFDIHFPSSVARMILRANSYHLGMETASGVLTFDFPQGTFADDVFFTAFLPRRPVPPVAEPGFKASDVAVEVLNDKNLQPVKEIGMGFYYAPGMLAELDRTRLTAVYFDDPTGRWVLVNSRCDHRASMVMARARHFCIYRLVQMVPSENLSGVKIYPNPYTPGSGDRYDDAMAGGGIAFSGLTGRATLRIFTVAGELVLQHEASDGTGVFVWDTKTGEGRKAASGVYIYYVTNPDTAEKQKGRFSILR